VLGNVIEYHFEEATTLADLQVKVAKAVANKWVPQGEPRQFEVRITPDITETRYSQTLVRMSAAKPENEVTRAPWQFLRR
jgi:hypothetical protein